MQAKTPHPVLVFASLIVAGLVFCSLVPAQDAPTRTLITNVNVWDGTSDALRTGQDVLIEGNLIVQVGAGIRAPGATVIDGGGGTLMPGLIGASWAGSVPEHRGAGGSRGWPRLSRLGRPNRKMGPLVARRLATHGV